MKILKYIRTGTKHRLPIMISVFAVAIALVGLGTLRGAKPAAAYTATTSSSSLATNGNRGSKVKATAITTQPSSTTQSGVMPTNTTTSSSVSSGSSSVVAAPALSRASSLYAWPNTQVARAASAYTGDATSVSRMRRLAGMPMAVWLTGAASDASTASSLVSAASAAGQVPSLVLYNIPERDCGSYSSGGASSASAYQSWVNGIAAAIGQRQAIVIVEPDALAGMDCLSGADQQSRLQLINNAVQSLRQQTAAAIYIDAGNSNWQSTSVMAGRLNNAGIAQASGFSLNVSNFQTTAASASYGSSLSAALGGKHFVVDTSRNGNGPTADNAWCNPDGRAFGAVPSLQTGNSLIDAYLWIKNPGESDGSCGGPISGTNPPSSGAWWPEYALMLAANSGW